MGNIPGVHGQVAGNVGLARPENISHDAFPFRAETGLAGPFNLPHGVQGGVAGLPASPNAQEEIPEGNDGRKG